MESRDDGDGTARPASLEDVRRDVCDFLAEELEKNLSGFAGDLRLVEDLGADSVVLLALLERLQRRYRVRANNASGKSGYAASICFNGGTTCGGTVGL